MPHQRTPRPTARGTSGQRSGRTAFWYRGRGSPGHAFPLVPDTDDCVPTVRLGVDPRQHVGSAEQESPAYTLGTRTLAAPSPLVDGVRRRPREGGELGQGHEGVVRVVHDHY